MSAKGNEEHLNQVIIYTFTILLIPVFLTRFHLIALRQILYQAQEWYPKMTPSLHNDYLEHGEIIFNNSDKWKSAPVKRSQ